MRSLVAVLVWLWVLTSLLLFTYRIDRPRETVRGWVAATGIVEHLLLLAGIAYLVVTP